jgi:hypothetical protein
MRQIRFRSLLLVFVAFILLAPALVSAENSPSTAVTSPPKTRLFLNRIRFLTADSFAHFRYVDTAPGKVTARDLYYKLSTRLQINLSGDGRTYLQLRGESGRNFQASFDYTGVGMHHGYWSFNLKSLFLAQKIGEHFEAQAGGIEFDRGAGTEITYADNDGWLEGYRVMYSGKSRALLPDKISVSVGYVGDFLQPNVFARLPRMGEENYVQILASRRFGPNQEASVEFDSIQTIRYARPAFHWQKMPLRVIDEGYVEAMIRASDHTRFGWSSSLFKGLDSQRRARLGVFYSDMPDPIFRRGKSVVLQNGDSYLLGKRIGPTLRWTLPRNFEVSMFGSRRLDDTPGPRYRFHATLRYSFASLLNRMLM